MLIKCVDKCLIAIIFLAALISRHAPEPSATPMKIKCPTCNQKIESQIETETYSKTHFWAAGNESKIIENISRTCE